MKPKSKRVDQPVLSSEEVDRIKTISNLVICTRSVTLIKQKLSGSKRINCRAKIIDSEIKLHPESKMKRRAITKSLRNLGTRKLKDIVKTVAEEYRRTGAKICLYSVCGRREM